MPVETPKGMIAWFLMKPDVETSDLIGVAVFESKEAHLANANSPEQHSTCTKIIEHLESETAWTDGHYIAGQVS